MSPTGSASWSGWPWQSSRLRRIELCLDEMKKQFEEEVKADKERLIADKEKIIADKEMQLKVIKADKEMQLKEIKADKEMQLKEIKADKEMQLKEIKADKERLYKQLQQQKIETLRELSRFKVIPNNRALIEFALSSSGMSLTKALEMFVDEHLLTADTKTLRKEELVGKELENLMHEISKPLPRPHVSEALAIVISKLQECKLVENLDVLLVDGEGKCKCMLTDGEIIKYSEE
ncbi:hypothetical protein GUITHDRAFT_102861 [Guillardia theta CCMP2712]|uniref:Uncharacterized protein n=1 Tax=Guillardia theta (strain CCMP2712) TaxID=905079 RepID=L1JTR8_GUITC|nr:hypothetical protein GUITHDRAFT_102861 [Guillardia theta CCMP2712]EKX51600.1 hypothetical protein GUITHDRAFT_102861 [Guillardia theta CCMP2712]|eukprot:XP_005838580.1 hypothetical protein GUITHDRAFT_102861 [Guillardia theta CCMP2712]